MPTPSLAELDHLERLLRTRGVPLRSRVLCSVRAGAAKLPLYGLTIGSADRRLPTLGLFGGVHGLERIGTQVVITYLAAIVERLQWDADLIDLFRNCRIAAIPLINPGGMLLGRRGNPEGIDLMRNAPVDAHVRPPLLAGGHRLSRRLPWYRGASPGPMAREARALVEFVQRELFEAPVALGLDCHSGFGARDRLWYPYAKTTAPFPRANEVAALSALLQRTYPDHGYLVEPQSVNYTAHGDLWDYLFDLHQRKAGARGAVFIPWTLEMGSWDWLRRNPLRLLYRDGLFNPGSPLRSRQTARRHLLLMDFLLRAVRNHPAWYHGGDSAAATDRSP